MCEPDSRHIGNKLLTMELFATTGTVQDDDEDEYTTTTSRRSSKIGW